MHCEDVNILLDVLHRLVDQGNIMIVIEHNLDLAMPAGWAIDFSPEGGKGGARVVARGRTVEVTAHLES